MNVDYMKNNIKYGQRMKYKEICEMMGDNVLEGGFNKKLQLERWRQWYEIEKDKAWFTIIKKYNKKEVSIVENSGRYTTHIENILMETLHTVKGKEKDYVVLTNRDILEMAYMVNKNYFDGKNNPHKFIDCFKLNINKADLPSEAFAENQIYSNTKIFFSASYRLLKRVVADSLKSIEKKSLITVNKTFVLYKNYVDANGFWHSERYECTEREHNRVLGVQRKSIDRFNKEAPVDENGKKKYFMKDMYSIGYLYDHARNYFNDILTEELVAEFIDDGYNAYANAYKINMASEDCFNYVIKQMKHSQLNSNIQDKMLTAKDLEVIETTLRKELVGKFIKV